MNFWSGKNQGKKDRSYSAVVESVAPVVFRVALWRKSQGITGLT
ncbi:hypothetical protein [uncultured Nostoc sp.]